MAYLHFAAAMKSKRLLAGEAGGWYLGMRLLHPVELLLAREPHVVLVRRQVPVALRLQLQPLLIQQLQLVRGLQGLTVRVRVRSRWKLQLV